MKRTDGGQHFAPAASSTCAQSDILAHNAEKEISTANAPAASKRSRVKRNNLKARASQTLPCTSAQRLDDTKKTFKDMSHTSAHTYALR